MISLLEQITQPDSTITTTFDYVRTHYYYKNLHGKKIESVMTSV